MSWACGGISGLNSVLGLVIAYRSVNRSGCTLHHIYSVYICSTKWGVVVLCWVLEYDRIYIVQLKWVNSARNLLIVLKGTNKMDPAVQPYIDERGRLLVRLDRALYRCVQSAKLWYDTLRTYLESIGFAVNPVDQCVFNRTVNGKQCCFWEQMFKWMSYYYLQ